MIATPCCVNPVMYKKSASCTHTHTHTHGWGVGVAKPDDGQIMNMRTRCLHLKTHITVTHTCMLACLIEEGLSWPS